MTKVYNFSAGPAMLPEAVMQQAQQELLDWQGLGVSVMEISHRSAEFKAIAATAEADMRELLGVSDDYAVLFLHGGGQSQFSMVPMNLLGDADEVAYTDFGTWGHLAIAEARRYAKVRVVAELQTEGLIALPPQSQWQAADDCAYLYTVDNETVQGVEIPWQVDSPVPLVSDMSSNLLTRPVDVSRYGLIYACAQKNLGPAGVTIVVVKKSLLERAPISTTPKMFDYRQHVDKQSMLNTSPTFPWYMTGLVLKWMKAEGGVAEFARRNAEKAQALYACIDASEWFVSRVDPACRSRMNAVFHCREPQHEAAFLQFAHNEGLLGLKGHRSVGGLRASIYNAMPMAGVQRLIEVIQAFSPV